MHDSSIVWGLSILYTVFYWNIKHEINSPQKKTVFERGYTFYKSWWLVNNY